MIKKFFVPDEDFSKMICDSLPGKEINHLNLISTGWTNIVYEAQTNDGNYFFRFPRDDFWIRTIVKDCEFANFIKGKTSYQTSDLKLKNDNSRFFSMHKKVDGTALTEKIDILNKEEINTLTYEIADFMYQLHHVKFNKNEIFKAKNIGLNLVDFLDELLEVHIDKENKEFWNYDNFIQKDNSCLVHGDFNPGNIILDENNHIAAVIDFGFAGFGNKYFDIARILSRKPSKEFKAGIIGHYEDISGEKLDYERLETEIKIWEEIDGAYINYMRKIGIYK